MGGRLPLARAEGEARHAQRLAPRGLGADGARRADGHLQLLESGAAGDRWLSTRQAFDWTPNAEGEWIQVTFDLVADKVDPAGNGAERIAYLLALHDYNDNSPVAKGNVLVDGNPAGGAQLALEARGAPDVRVAAAGT